jgi:hypothetical protein
MQTLPGALFTGRWSNVSPVGPGYLAIGNGGGDQDSLFWSYSTVEIGGCSGTFVAPNILLTAAHCSSAGIGDAPRDFRSFIYEEGSDHASTVLIQSTCEALVRGIDNGAGDVMLMYCDDILWGQQLPPGEVLGMADFDPNPLAMGDSVWVSWQNPLCNSSGCNLGQQMIFGSGNVTNLSLSVYGVDGVGTDILYLQGSSGSTLWKRSNDSHHRLVGAGRAFGPIPTPPPTPSLNHPGVPGGGGSTILAALNDGISDPRSSPRYGPDNEPAGVNTSLMTSLGLIGGSSGFTEADYIGASYDADGNLLFDVQERLDAIRGVDSGNTIWLGFSSPRLNGLWNEIGSGAALITFRDWNHWLEIDFSSSSPQGLLELPRISLDANSTYRFSVMSATDDTSVPSGLEFELWSPTGTSPDGTLSISTPPDSSWRMATGTLQTSAGTSILRIRANGVRWKGRLAALVLVKDGSVNGFDTHSERHVWKDNETGSRSWIVPYGREAPGGAAEISWAGLVNDSTPQQVDYSLRNRQLAIVPGRQYELCFDVRSFPPGAGSGTGRVRLGSGAGAPPGDSMPLDAIYINETFPVTNTWQTRCTVVFNSSESDNLLKFGHIFGEPEYLVDNIHIQ